MNPETLRTLFKRSTQKKGEWNLGMLEAALELYADAWETDRQRLEAAEANILRMENDKACLPEDVSVTEYVASLRKRLEAAEKRAQLEFVAMLCHNNGGEIRLMPVLLRGDEEVVVWDAPLTLERVYRIRSSALAAGDDEDARRDMFGRTHPKTAGEET